MNATKRASQLDPNPELAEKKARNPEAARSIENRSRSTEPVEFQTNCLGNIRAFVHTDEFLEDRSDDQPDMSLQGLAERLRARSMAKESLAADTYLSTTTAYRLRGPPSERFLLRFPSFPRCLEAIDALKSESGTNSTDREKQGTRTSDVEQSKRVLERAKHSPVFIDEALEPRNVRLTSSDDNDNVFRHQGLLALNYLIEASYAERKKQNRKQIYNYTSSQESDDEDENNCDLPLCQRSTAFTTVAEDSEGEISPLSPVSLLRETKNFKSKSSTSTRRGRAGDKVAHNTFATNGDNENLGENTESPHPARHYSTTSLASASARRVPLATL